MPDRFSVSEVAQQCDTDPRRITALFYNRKVPEELGPVVAGRRMIPESSLPAIRAALAAQVRRAPRKAVAAHG